MSNLGNLFFELGLDTEKFKKAWQNELKSITKDAKIDVSLNIKPIEKDALKAMKEQLGVNTELAKKEKEMVRHIYDRVMMEEKLNAIKKKNALLESKTNKENKLASSADALARNREFKLEQDKIKAANRALVTRKEHTREIHRGNDAKKKAGLLIGANNRGLYLGGRLSSDMQNSMLQYISYFAAFNLLKNIALITGEFEKQKVALTSIIGNAQVAEGIFEQIKSFAVKSPFQFKDLISYTKQLSAYSIPTSELFSTMKMLADASAGLGVGMDRLVLAFGQIRAASVLRGQEIRQLTEAGIPIMELLRQKFEALGEEGITVSEVFDKVSARLVPFSMVAEVFDDMTSAGGKFFRMQERQADTVAGKISNLTDAYHIMLYDIGEGIEGNLKASIDLVSELMRNYRAISGVIIDATLALITYRTTIAAVNKINAISNTIQAKKIALMRLESISAKQNAALAITNASLVAARNQAGIVAGGVNIVGRAVPQAMSNTAVMAVMLRQSFAKLGTVLLSTAGVASMLGVALGGLVYAGMRYNRRVREMADVQGGLKRALREVSSEISNNNNIMDDSIRVLRSSTASVYEQNEALEALKKAFVSLEGYSLAQILSLSNEDLESIKIADQRTRQLDAIFNDINKRKDFYRKSSFKNLPIIGNALGFVLGQSAEEQWREGKLLELDKIQEKQVAKVELVAQIDFIALDKDNESKKIKFNTLKDIYKNKIKDANDEIAKIYGDNALSGEEKKKRGKAIQDMIDSYRDDIALIDVKLSEVPQTNQFREDIRKYLESAQIGKEITELLTPKQDDGLRSYVDRLREIYKTDLDNLETLANSPYLSPNVKQKMLERKKAIEDLFRTLRVPLDPSTKSTKSDDSSSKAMIKEIEGNATSILNAIEQYNKLLESGVSKSSAKSVITGIFGDFSDVVDIFDLELAGFTIQPLIDSLQRLGDEGNEAAQKILDGLRKSQDEKALNNVMEQQKSYNSLLQEARKAAEDYASTEEKIARLTKEKEDAMMRLRIGGASDVEIKGIEAKYDDQINQLKQSLFELTPFYQQLFGDLAEESGKSLQKIIDMANDATSTVKHFKDSAGKDKVSIMIGGEEFEMTLSAYRSFLNRINNANKELETKKPFKALSNALTELRNEFKKSEKDLDKPFMAVGRAMNDVLSTVRPFTDGLSEMLKGLGEDSAAEVINAVVSSVSNIAQGFAQGGLFGGIMAIGGEIMKGLGAIFARHDKKLEKQIEKSQRRLKDLEAAYQRFEKSMALALGSDKYDLEKAKLQSLRSQTNEIQKQLILEDKKRKSDKDKMQDLRNQLMDIKLETRLLMNSIYEDVLGGSVKSMAQELGDALFDAITSGTSAMDALKTSVDEIIKGITKTMLVQKLIEKPLGKIVDKYTSTWFEGDTFLGEDKVLGSLGAFSQELTSLGENIIPVMQVASDSLGLIGSSSADGGLGKQVSTIQESTANLLGSYINGIRADVSINKDIMNNMYKEMIGVNNSLSSAISYLSDIKIATQRSATSVMSILEKLEDLTRAGGATKLNVKAY